MSEHAEFTPPVPLPQTGVVLADEDTEVATLSLTVKDMAAMVTALAAASGMSIDAVVAGMGGAGGGSSGISVAGAPARETTGLLVGGGGSVGGGGAKGKQVPPGGGGAGGAWDAVAAALLAGGSGGGGGGGGGGGASLPPERVIADLRSKISGAGAALATLLDKDEDAALEEHTLGGGADAEGGEAVGGAGV